MRTAFFASDPIARDAIEFLRKSREYPLACVVSNPDRPKGRGNKVAPNEVYAWAIAKESSFCVEKTESTKPPFRVCAN